MSTIKVHPDEFADIVVAYMYDMLRDEDNIPDNEEFRKLVQGLKNQGIKPLLYHHYISSNSQTRILYKRIKPALLTDGGELGKILVTKGDTDYIKEDQEFDRELCKKIFRTIKEYRMKHPSRILNEGRVDKIIDYCIEQSKKKTEEQQNG